jgi:hypothetical protein
MTLMLVERFIAFMDHFASFSVGDLLAVPIPEADAFHKFLDERELAGASALGDRSDKESVKPTIAAIFDGPACLACG